MHGLGDTMQLIFRANLADRELSRGLNLASSQLIVQWICGALVLFSGCFAAICFCYGRPIDFERVCSAWVENSFSRVFWRKSHRISLVFGLWGVLTVRIHNFMFSVFVYFYALREKKSRQNHVSRVFFKSTHARAF